MFFVYNRITFEIYCAFYSEEELFSHLDSVVYLPDDYMNWIYLDIGSFIQDTVSARVKGGALVLPFSKV